MLMMGLALVIVAFIVLIWMNRGFFSAFLHLVATVVAGAIAFAVWEPLAMLMINSAPERGFGLFIGDAGWALGLAAPFIVSLVLIRKTLDSTVRANAICSDLVNYIGGGACAAAAGIISAGITIISIGTLRFDPDYLGYQPVVYNEAAQGKGAPIIRKTVLRPFVDEWTAGFYSYLSRTSLRPGQDTLARWHPDVAMIPTTLRMTYEGKSRNTAKDKDFSVTGRYTVGDTAQGEEVGPLLMRDGWNNRPQTAVDFRGTEIKRGHIEGFIVNFNSSAREQGGTAQVLVGNGQVRLVCEDLDGRSHTYFPVAVISQADGKETSVARWRYDGPELFISTVGGSSKMPMAFDFVVPTGQTPLALYVKGVRHEIEDQVPAEARYTNQLERFNAVMSGRLLPGFTAALQPADPRAADRNLGTGVGGPRTNASTQMLKLATDRPPRRGEITLDAAGVTISNALGFMLRKGQERSMKVEDDGSGRNVIVDGVETYSKSEIKSNIGLTKNLQINRFKGTSDTALVMVDVSYGKPMSILSAANPNPLLPAVLVDSTGQTFEAVGYIYEDQQNYKVRYTPSSPLGSLNDAPNLTMTNPDRKLKLIFRVSVGVNLVRFGVGDIALADWTETPVTVKAQR